MGTDRAHSLRIAKRASQLYFSYYNYIISNSSKNLAFPQILQHTHINRVYQEIKRCKCLVFYIELIRQLTVDLPKHNAVTEIMQIMLV